MFSVKLEWFEMAPMHAVLLCSLENVNSGSCLIFSTRYVLFLLHSL